MLKQSVHTKKELLEILHFNKDSIKSFGVRHLNLFGSFAKDSGINEKSDIDFLVEFESGKKSFDNFMELSFF